MVEIKSVTVEIKSVMVEIKSVMVEIQNWFNVVLFDCLHFPVYSEWGIYLHNYRLGT